MFALEITFKDGVSDPELIFVRRQSAIVGASEDAHIEIQDMQSENFQLRLSRDLGRRFRCRPIATVPGVKVPPMLEGVYEEQGVFDAGAVKLLVVPLDSDLQLKDSETLDRAGVRVLRQACANPSPLFPSLVVLGEPPVIWSFMPTLPVYIGTSKECGLRIESQALSAKHARIGFESGQFWVEDLGSSNGTFVRDVQVSGRLNVVPGQPISLGKQVTVVGVTSEEQISGILSTAPAKVSRSQIEERRYPVLISVSEVARPARLVIPIDGTINIGRDPTSDIWLGAPHVSRRHCSITFGKTGQISVSDHSTNGTAYDDGVLRRGDVLQLIDQGRILDFGGGVTLAICFNEEQEKKFIASGGSPTAFKPIESMITVVEGKGARKRPSAVAMLKRRSGGQGKERLQEMMNQFGTTYRALGLRSKVTFFITIFSVLVVMIVILNLIIHISF